MAIVLLMLMGSASLSSCGSDTSSSTSTAATPKEKMKKLAADNGMELLTFMDRGGGNVSFTLRSPVKNTHVAQEVVDVAKANGILRNATFVSSGVSADNFNGAVNDTLFEGFLK